MLRASWLSRSSTLLSNLGALFAFFFFSLCLSLSSFFPLFFQPPCFLKISLLLTMAQMRHLIDVQLLDRPLSREKWKSGTTRLWLHTSLPAPFIVSFIFFFLYRRYFLSGRCTLASRNGCVICLVDPQRRKSAIFFPLPSIEFLLVPPSPLGPEERNNIDFFSFFEAGAVQREARVAQWQLAGRRREER